MREMSVMEREMKRLIPEDERMWRFNLFDGVA